jgi:hypothetical protein
MTVTITGLYYVERCCNLLDSRICITSCYRLAISLSAGGEFHFNPVGEKNFDYVVGSEGHIPSNDGTIERFRGPTNPFREQVYFVKF